MDKKYDHLFRYKDGSICKDFYPGAVVSYSRGFRNLTDIMLKDPDFRGTPEQMIRHILYTSKSNQTYKSPGGTVAIFEVSLGIGSQFKRRLKVVYERNQAGELEHVALMLTREKLEKIGAERARERQSAYYRYSHIILI